MKNPENVRILVTGSRGQLGSEIRAHAAAYPAFQFTYADIEDLDLANEEAVQKYFTSHSFDAIINCAAYTAVDLAEDNEALAYKVNAESLRVLAEICRTMKIRLVHISTDYVFDGNSNKPMTEDMTPAPLSVYGKSKLEGEEYVLSILNDAYVIRTAWVYSTFGKNFVKTITKLGRERSELSVVADQIGTPTYAHDLAGVILFIIEAVFSGRKDVPGIYHYTNEGVISWYDFAYFILTYYGLPCKLKPIRTDEYKTRAARPKFSLLDKRKIRDTFGITPPHWHESLLTCLKKMDTSALQ
jgi:dTDP-4-dehydrorhamnose reductase